MKGKNVYSAYNPFNKYFLTEAINKHECFAWTFKGCCGDKLQE